MRILESIEDHAAIITLELKHESKDETSSLKDLFIAMGCARHTDPKIVPTILGVL